MRHKWYVGISETTRDAFTSADTPTPAAYPQYFAVVGPFRTKRGAVYMAQYGGNGNPHLQTVADAEYYAKREEEEKKRLGREFLRSQANLEYYPD